VTIRALAPADIPAAAVLLAALDRTLTSQVLRERLKAIEGRTDHQVWVYERDGKVAGVAHAYIRPALEKPRELVLQSIAVDPTHRTVGIGRALMGEAERWARSRGLTSVALHTRNAAPFYRKLGYNEVSAPAFMRKTLT
jgi:N-acetylglutamate synthase-like GNAT family acetyltransferase